MCVIIVRDPGITIPQDKLESACIVNPDGWGLAIADRGKLEYRHELINNPDVIAKALEAAKTHTVLLHLRFITAGEKSIQNCHPFKTMTREADGFDITFSHNGTLYPYKPTNGEVTSDSYNFNQRFVRPLVLRTAAFVGNANALDDKFLSEQLEDKCGSSSKFALMDGNGQALIINYNDGEEHDGWWSSNTYSFERTHRTGTSYTSPTGKTYYDTNYGTDYESWWEKEYGQKSLEEMKGAKDPPFTPNVCSLTPKQPELPMPKEFEPDEAEENRMENVLEQAEDFGKAMKAMSNPRMNPKLVSHLLSRKSPSFTEITKTTSLSEMTRFDPEDINEMVSYYPDLSAILIQDLLYELYLKDSAVVKARAEDIAARKTEEAA